MVTLRDGYDVGDRLADDPLVWSIDDFLSADERTHLVEIAGAAMGEARVSRLGADAPSARRSGRVGWIRHDTTPVASTVVGRIADLVGLPVSHAESLQVVHYGRTQQYEPHFDAWDVTTAKGREKTAVGGNRAVTALVYLTDVAGGGGTVFPELGLTVEPRPGRLCLFHDLVPGSHQRHPGSLHGGLPVTAGEKWACNLWFRERPYAR